MTQPGSGFANKPVVYLKYPHLNGYLLGFLTGRFTNADGERMVTVFLPNVPNPITGFVLVFHETEVLMSDLSVDDAWKLIISGGLVSPKKIKSHVRPVASKPEAPHPNPDDTTRTE